MVTEIVRWCSLCFATDVRVTASNYTLGIGGRQRTVDLCDGCAEQVVKPLQALLDQYGQPVDGEQRVKRQYRRRQPVEPTAQPGEQPAAAEPGEAPAFVCILCDHEPFAARTGLFRHYGTAHGFATSTERGDGVDSLSVYGDTCPLCNVVPGSLVGHARTTHRMPIPALFATALAEGDPHGIIAQRRAAAPTP